MIRGHAWSETPRKSGLVIEGEQVHKRVLVSGFGGGVEYARLVFDGMRERSVASWNSLLAGYVWCRDVDGAQRIFNEISKWNMRMPGVELDKVALMAPSSACAKKGT
ncbi:hypothetical protein ACFX2H_035975 [Malus domestica]